jgi:1-aminocyclopropane-1-carboxylate deaminase/D-cysteine desulfhydrase-like pyridoxal-dependent ACC family enzyme
MTGPRSSKRKRKRSPARPHIDKASITVTRLFRDHTPIEKHRVGSRRVMVKREDLYGIAPAPPLGKLRGLRLFLADAYRRGIHLIGCWDTRVSMLGLGLAACCHEFPGMRCIVSYPMRRQDATPPLVARAGSLGAELFPVAAARINICFAAARRHVEKRGGLMLPFGLECQQAVDAVAKEAARVKPDLISRGTVVLSCGSGVSLAGLLRGFSARPHRLIGISSGRSLHSILRCVRRYVPEIPSYLELREAQVPYRIAMNYPCPFPSNPYYDLKAWKYLADHRAQLRSPLLFWNIGA